jgi:hypothetical protein
MRPVDELIDSGVMAADRVIAIIGRPRATVASTTTPDHRRHRLP